MIKAKGAQAKILHKDARFLGLSTSLDDSIMQPVICRQKLWKIFFFFFTSKVSSLFSISVRTLYS